MKSSLFEYLSGNVPGGMWGLLSLLAITWFILWFVYYFSGVLARKRFFWWGLRLTLLWLLLYLLFWLRFPPPGGRVRILLTIQEPVTHSDSSAQAYVTEHVLYSQLCYNLNPDRFIVYPLDYSLQIGNWDSLAHPDYLNRLVHFLSADYIVTLVRSHPDTAFHAILSPGNDPAKSLFSASLPLFAKAFQFFSDGVVQVCDRRAKKRESVTSPFLAKSWSLAEWLAWGKGRLAWLKQDLPAARELFLYGLDLNPQFFPAYLGLAQVELDSALVIQNTGGYYQEHLALAYNYLYLFKKGGYADAEALRLWGEYAILSQNFVLAEQNLKKCLRHNPNDEEAYLDLARLHPSRYRDLNFMSEESLYRQALFLNPGSVSAHIWYGNYLFSKGRVKEALSLYQNFLAVFPQQSDLQLALGKLLISTQSYQPALDLFEKLLRSDPKRAELARFNLAIVHFHSGDTLAAQIAFEEIATAHSNPDAYLYLATIAEKRGNLDLAIDFLRKRIQENRGMNDPYKEEARKHLVTLLKKRGEPVE